VVLTARDADYQAYDANLAAEIPEGVKVYRSRIFEPYRLYRTFTGRTAEESTDIATLSLDESAKRRFSERVSEWVRAAFFVPDARAAWRPFAYRLGKKIVRAEHIDVIFSSAPPYTTHLIGLALHRKTALPWVADFRDSWIGWVSAPQWRPKFSRAIEFKMERSVLEQADRILTVSHGVKEDLLGRHPELRDERWHLLPNGFDAADFDGLQPVPKNDRITITYVGSLYGARHPEGLLQALESLQKTNSGIVEKLFFRLVGRVGESIVQRIQSSPVSRLFEFIPYVTHKESLSYLLGSDVSLLIIDDAPANRGILTGKLYEYIGAGRPILALAPDGEAAELIRAKHLGWVAPPRDAAAIQQTLQEMIPILGKGEGASTASSVWQTQFERRHLTGELARILDEVMEVKGIGYKV
jgi:glycosyltransferase involved in cell wall biosynthesis